MLATTLWDVIHPNKGAQRKEIFKTDEGIWESLYDGVGPILRHSRSRESAVTFLEWAMRSQRPLQTDGRAEED